jgi:hypothetical protein
MFESVEAEGGSSGRHVYVGTTASTFPENFLEKAAILVCVGDMCTK